MMPTTKLTMRLTVAYVFLLLACAQLSFAQDLETKLDKLRADMEAIGLSVVVVKNSEIVYTHSSGWKDRESKVALTREDLFRIASISKSFSATSIMQLMEAGKVSLDMDVSDLIGFKVRNPKYPNAVITLKMLMSHTSSINDSQKYSSLDIINPEKNENWAKCYSDYAPGAGYKYCNMNYNMVGTIVERLSGERFDNYVKHHILDPLQLKAGFNIDSLNAGRFAKIYQYDEKSNSFNASDMAYVSLGSKLNKYVMGYSAPMFSPTGGLKISAPDLAKYMIMHMNFGTASGQKIISKESARLMQTIVSDEQSYGLGLRTIKDMFPGKTMVGHTGSMFGLYSMMFFNPDEKFGFVAVTNGSKAGRNDFAVDKMLYEASSLLYKKYFQ